MAKREAKDAKVEQVDEPVVVPSEEKVADATTEPREQQGPDLQIGDTGVLDATSDDSTTVESGSEPEPEDLIEDVLSRLGDAPSAPAPLAGQPDLTVIDTNGHVQGYVGKVETGPRHIALSLEDTEQGRAAANRLLGTRIDRVEGAGWVCEDVANKSISAPGEPPRVVLISREPLTEA